jgi:UDP-N-acetylglucosamine diphosphorylase / glucose-1-phosphate thymidylyltransferase / UDP-N-acetylgalactosamine diphosphorylase / glucosamine-1-phosphate N-acetyltransferase / galactosamine-1-phosphate N-acetyltransferase
MQMIADLHPEKLWPFTLTRKVEEIRIGILTIKEKWERSLLSLDVSINPGLLPTPALVKQINALVPGQSLFKGEADLLAYRPAEKASAKTGKKLPAPPVSYTGQLLYVQSPTDIFRLNDAAIREDFRLVTRRRKTQPVSKTNKIIRPSQVFIEKGAKVEFAILNASAGPIYIGKNAEIMEGSIIRGPFSLGEGAVVKMGAKIYGATTIGPYCVAGGEIKNSVMMGYSNKAHDGYLGDAVIGEWCNLGAGTSNSNLKNSAGEVMVWDHHSGSFYSAGLKCGLLMGDYSRSAINTSFNTGTVVGVSCNIFGEGLTPKYIPDFSWGMNGAQRYELDKALRDIENWKQLKQHTLNDTETGRLKELYAMMQQ